MLTDARRGWRRLEAATLCIPRCPRLGACVACIALIRASCMGHRYKESPQIVVRVHDAFLGPVHTPVSIATAAEAENSPGLMVKSATVSRRRGAVGRGRSETTTSSIRSLGFL